MSAITTHVLDTARGCPAAGVQVWLHVREGATWRNVGEGTTDKDGRLRTLLPDHEPLPPGDYQLVFETGAYFRRVAASHFLPRVVVEFTVASGEQHYHVPLLLSPFGYTTYRGS